METYVRMKALAANPYFGKQREKSRGQLRLDEIDPPIVDIISTILNIPYCFTLQCCYGHFLYNRQNDPHNIARLSGGQAGSFDADPDEKIEYRIAYLALCIQENTAGKELLAKLANMPSIAPGLIQFGCAEWFWKRQVNSYVVQVEPERFKERDKIIVDFDEALEIENARDKFFKVLSSIFGPTKN